MNEGFPLMSGPDDTVSPSTLNRILEDALLEYCRFPHAQGFAVMLSGEWGSGKTHFIKAFLQRMRDERATDREKNPIYITLYGVADQTDIADQLFQQLHPLLSHKATRLFGAVLKSVAKATIRVDLDKATTVSGAIPDVDLSSMLRDSKGRVIVFDDFERAQMGPASILGYINPLVEHDDCKVIVVADEAQIEDKPNYLLRKEKTVGKTYRLASDPARVLGLFLERIDDVDARKFLQSSQDNILSIFDDSQTKNLRSLKQFLWDFELLFKALLPKQRANSTAMRELLQLVCAASLELRSGDLQFDNFGLADVGHYLALRQTPPNAAAVAKEAVFSKYPTKPFDSTMLSAETIKSLIMRSEIVRLHVQVELQQHPRFGTRDSAPSWVRLWYAGEASGEQRQQAIDDFKVDFNCRVFRDRATIDHMLDLALFLSDLDLDEWSSIDVEAKLRKYIDDRYVGEANIDELTPDHSVLSEFSGSGLGFIKLGDSRFDKIREYHYSAIRAWARRAYPSVAERLMTVMREDSESFLRDICFTPAGPARYARLAVLAPIAPKMFAETICSLDYASQRKAFVGLSLRYQQATVETELAEEIPWLRNVANEIRILVSHLDPLGRFHYTKFTKMFLDDPLEKVEAQLSARKEARTKPVA